MLNVVAPICTGSVHPPPRPRWALLFKYGLFWPRRTQRINKIKYLIVLQSPESLFVCTTEINTILKLKVGATTFHQNAISSTTKKSYLLELA
jgi:hypothetical protein